MSTALAALAGVTCLACCVLPVLITAGLLGGAVVAAGIVSWLPAVAAALVVSTVVAWGWTRSRTRRRGCPPADADRGCSCKTASASDADTTAARLQSRP